MSMTGGRQVLSLTVLAVLAAAAAPVEAQYFGRQKVQYDDFDWRVLTTPHFEVHFYPEEEEVTGDAARMSERWYDRLSRAFQHEFDTKPLIFYADHPDFQQTNVIGGMLTEGTGGVTEALRNRVIMPFTGVYRDNDHVIGHELVHVFQYDIAQSPGGGGLAGMSRLPDWLVEGMAEYLSLGREDPNTAMWLRDAALRGELPTLAQLGRDPRFFPYRYGQALWAFIAGRWGDRAVPELYRFATRAGLEVALQRVLGVTGEQLSQDWITSIRATYLPLLEGRQRPEDAGAPILYDDEIGAMHLAPAVSPDGRFVAFYGRREIFTVDLLLADAQTGRILETLTSPNRDSHFDALSFIQGAGSWSPDGRKFAFVVFEQGDNRLAILDVGSQDVERRIEVAGVGGISTPAWSPDGRTIAFSGSKGGISDLFLYDIESGEVRQITDDKYAEVHPTWSPDGRTIAFATDRGPDTDLDRLVFGEMNLALIDVATGSVRLLEIFPQTRHINPQFSPDGQSLYFIAGKDGFSDIFRLSLADNSLYRVTQIATGVSGITALSPAMSVSSQDGRMMFSVFENSGHNIYAIDCSQPCGTPEPRTVAELAPAGLLPPVEAAQGGLVSDYLADPDRGLPAASVAYEVSGYDASLGLDYIGPPSFGVSVGGPFGTGLYGGVSFFFGDMLGDQFLGAAVQAQGSFKDVGGQVLYQNSRNRLNWGGTVAHIPYLTGFARGFENATTIRIEQHLQRIFVDQAALFTKYPLSTTRRFELSGGFTRYSFDTEIQTWEFDRFTGRIIGDVEITEGPEEDPLNMFEGAVAYVGDNSFFGFTSPISGSRFRFEVAPTIGSINYRTLLLDYRRYKLMNPVTLAFRAMHYGRYGGDAEDRRLSRLYLGYESLIRGYAQESIDFVECVPEVGNEEQNSCPVFDRLVGSRLAIANVELRLPLIGTAGYGLIDFPFLPTEIAPFFDAGLAWTQGESPELRFDRNTAERVPVFSTGIAARMNLMGVLILETYWAYPFQRPGKGGHWGFNIAPGW